MAGPLGTLLGSAQWKRASSRGEAVTSGFLSVSDSDCTVPAVGEPITIPKLEHPRQQDIDLYHARQVLIKLLTRVYQAADRYFSRG